MGSAEKDGEIVEHDAHARAGNLSKSKRKLPCVLAVIRLQGEVQLLEIGMEFAPDREFTGKVERLCDRASLSMPFHRDRLFGRGIATGDPEQEISRTCFSGAVADPDFHGGIGGIRTQMNLIDPNWRGGAELDFSNDTVPDRLCVLDEGMGTADIELLAVVDADEEVVFSGVAEERSNSWGY